MSAIQPQIANRVFFCVHSMWLVGVMADEGAWTLWCERITVVLPKCRTAENKVNFFGIVGMRGIKYFGYLKVNTHSECFVF
jgi:hypothetical protein